MTTVLCFTPKRFEDNRGWFSETYNERIFAHYASNVTFVQDNHSHSLSSFTLRGLHFQKPPYSQSKLVRCLRGRIYDVAVDVRAGSPTFGKWVGVELSAKNARQLFVPIGFAHGFLTLEPETEVLYKVTDFYVPECDSGIRWNDPALGIAWPLPKSVSPLLSSKDEALPIFADFVSPFEYDGNPLTSIKFV